MMYDPLTLITIFSFISPKFRNCFLQHYYISTLYRQTPYSTVIKLNIFVSVLMVTIHTLLCLFVIGEVTMGEGSMQDKRDIRSAFTMQFSSYYYLLLIS